MRELISRDSPVGSTVTVETDDICAYLSEKYSVFPKGGSIFHEGVNVTPRIEADISHLENLRGRFVVTVVPGAPIAVLAISTVITLAVGYLLRPNFDEEADIQWASGSPTNAPKRLTNRERIGQRVPDIYGRVLAIPDLLAPPRTVYENGVEVTYTYLCLGRGYFYVDQIRDGDIDIVDVAGYSAKIFEPGVKVTNAPATLIGNDFDVFSVMWRDLRGAQYENIPPRNNTTMYPEIAPGLPESNLYPRRAQDVTASAGHVRSRFGAGTGNPSPAYRADFDFSIHYRVGIYVTIGAISWVPGGSGSGPIPDIAGSYKVTRATPEYLWLDIPDDKVASWEALPVEPDSAQLRMAIVDDDFELNYTVAANSFIEVTISAPKGLYFGDASINAEVVVKFSVVAVWTQVETGFVLTISNEEWLRGATHARTGITVLVQNPYPSPDHDLAYSVAITVKRIDAFKPGSPSAWTKNSQDTVHLTAVRACFETGSGVTDTSMEITTLLTRVETTEETSALEKRGVAMDVRRTNNDGSHTLDYFPYIMEDMITDARIGRMNSSSVDLAAWLVIMNDLSAYFNDSTTVIKFSHVFDDINTSFETMLATVAQRCHLFAYRIGNVINVRAIVPQEIPTLLFNVRNKIPGTEVRTVRFGTESSFDGVIQPYIDLFDNFEKKEYVWPSAGSVSTPSKSQIVGINYEQEASVHAKRRYASLKYQNTQTVFEATEEAALLLQGDLILVTDGTRPNVIEGELININVTTLTLNTAVTLDPAKNYVVFLQQTDGTVTTHTLANVVSWAVTEIEVTIAPATTSTDVDNFARTTFLLVEDDGNITASRFLVESVVPANKKTYTVTALNYADELYASDNDPVS